MAEGNGVRNACSRRRIFALADGNHARSAGSRSRCCAVRICDRRRRSPWALDRGNYRCVAGHISNRHRASCEVNEGAPDSVGGGRAGYAVPPSTCHSPVRKVPWLARVRVCARVAVSSKAHSKSRSGGRRGGRGWETTMVARRSRVTEVSVVTVYLALPLVVPSRLT